MNPSSASAIRGIDIVTYQVQDGDRAKKFYRDILGPAVTSEYGPQGAEFELADGTTFGIWKMFDGSFEPSQGIVFAVADLKQCVTDFKTRGVAFDDDGAIVENPACFMVFAKDTEGNLFILHQRKEAALRNSET